MSPFAVIWPREHENELARLWVNASNKAAVAAAANRIDHLLARDPYAYGEDLSEGLYRIVELPLGVYYSIDSIGRAVQVEAVRLYS